MIAAPENLDDEKHFPPLFFAPIAGHCILQEGEELFQKVPHPASGMMLTLGSFLVVVGGLEFVEFDEDSNHEQIGIHQIGRRICGILLLLLLGIIEAHELENAFKEGVPLVVSQIGEDVSEQNLDEDFDVFFEEF